MNRSRHLRDDLLQREGGNKPASRTGRAKKDRNEDEEDVDLDEMEVRSSFLNLIRFSVLTFVWFQKARRERVEYFKKLDDYQLVKENVYVV
jgi:hypothetical protein